MRKPTKRVSRKPRPIQSEATVSRWVARYRTDGDAAFEPRSRRPKTTPTRLADVVIAHIVNLRDELTGQGLDAGPATIRWHLHQRHHTTVSTATIRRHLIAAGRVTQWSGRRDLNPRPPAPKAGALPSCATSRCDESKDLRRAAHVPFVSARVRSPVGDAGAGRFAHVVTASSSPRRAWGHHGE